MSRGCPLPLSEIPPCEEEGGEKNERPASFPFVARVGEGKKGGREEERRREDAVRRTVGFINFRKPLERSTPLETEERKEKRKKKKGGISCLGRRSHFS